MRVGFIGLGDMGQGIVPRLLDAGHPVTGWNRTPEKASPLLDLGMEWAENPREVALASEVILSIVTDARAVESVALGEHGVIAGLAADGIYAAMSTIDPEASRRISAAFADAGRVMLDAPLSGSPISVQQNKASVMVGGAQPDLRAIERLRCAYALWQKVAGAEGEDAARAWIISANPWLSDDTPVNAIRHDQFHQVAAAAQALVADSFSG